MGEAMPSTFGAVIASGPYLRSHADARLMIEMLERELRLAHGKPEEPKLAEWHRLMVQTRRRAEREKWQGWQA